MNRDIKINYNDKVYNTLSRFISYFHQIDLIRKYKPNSVLEIGIGSKIVSQHIENINIKVTTCDIDKNLSPDIVTDVRDLNLQDNSFDMVCACEILEHIPFADFEKTIQKLKNISKEYILISLPYPSIAFDFVIKIPS
ncbi:MAG: methyltransferase domain-containing protein [Candidatus Pacebacteria bacterium]|nr:methyltransferase domain-containing protein [Candidatus Paceibacterota bacterium]